jgi:hypothetical protein
MNGELEKIGFEEYTNFRAGLRQNPDGRPIMMVLNTDQKRLLCISVVIKVFRP